MADLRGRVMATLTRLGSATKPRLPISLQRTAENTMTSASRPWYPSTDETTTCEHHTSGLLPGKERRSVNAMDRLTL